MPRGRHLLTAKTAASLKEPGRYADGDGLYLHIRQRGSLERLWVFIYKRGERGAEKATTISLGPARNVTLAAAREKAAICRKALEANQDPRAALAPLGGVPTFGSMADDLVASISKGFLNKHHIAQWKMTLGDSYCKSIRSKPVDKIQTEDVLAVLKPIWLAKPETASRIRGRIERVLDSAKVLGFRTGENPASWRGHLAHLLPKRQRLTRGHHAALPWAEAPGFLARLRGLQSMSALALEWTILTASRTAETVGAEWSEIEGAVWTIPAKRMKAKREHRVPLPARCLEILDTVKPLGSQWIFPGKTIRVPLSKSAMAECLKGLNSDVTVHGFRSSFRDWAGETTSFPREIIEAALAHRVGDRTEQAYRRGDALERRRELMSAWERYLAERANVVRLRG